MTVADASATNCAIMVGIITIAREQPADGYEQIAEIAEHALRDWGLISEAVCWWAEQGQVAVIGQTTLPLH